MQEHFFSSLNKDAKHFHKSLLSKLAHAGQEMTYESGSHVQKPVLSQVLWRNHRLTYALNGFSHYHI